MCLLSPLVLIKSQCWKFFGFVTIPFYLVVRTCVLWFVTQGDLNMLGVAVMLRS